MTREILYRGKRIDNGEWVTGYFGCDNCSSEINPDTGAPFEDGYYITDFIMKDGISNNVFEIDPATLGQFTGLTDKNGKRIFEGDLVRYGYSSALGEFWDIGNVVYVPTDGCFEISNLCERYLKRLTQTQIVNSSIEVIGTVYDDKESE